MTNVSQKSNSISRERAPRFGVAAALLLVACSAPGCYNTAALIENAKAKAEHARREVVDLGEYVVSLPREPGATTTVEVAFHMFASVAKADVEQLNAELDDAKPVLRHQTILTIRNTPTAELGDPALAMLRDRVADVAKKAFPETPIEAIGFYEFAVFEL